MMGSINQPSASVITTPKDELTLLIRKWETTLSNQNLQGWPLLPFLASLMLLMSMPQLCQDRTKKSLPKHAQLMHLCMDGSWPYPWFNHSCIIVTSFQMVCINAIAELFGVKIERPATPPGERKRRGTCLKQIEAVDQKK